MKRSSFKMRNVLCHHLEVEKYWRPVDTLIIVAVENTLKSMKVISAINISLQLKLFGMTFRIWKEQDVDVKGDLGLIFQVFTFNKGFQ